MAKKRRNKGEGSVDQLPDGRWRAWASAGIDPATGKRRRPSVTAKTKAEATTKLRELLNRIDAGKVVTDSAVTVAEWMDGWLIRRTELAPASVAGYQQSIRFWKRRLGAVTLKGLSPAGILAALAKEPAMSASQRSRQIGVLRTFLNEAVDLELLLSNPAKKVRKLKPRPPKMLCLAPAEARHLIDVASGFGSPFDLLVRLLLDAGCRPSEALGLHWEDVRADAVHIHAALTVDQKRIVRKRPKTPAGNRMVYLTPPTVLMLARHRQILANSARPHGPGDPVFARRKRLGGCGYMFLRNVQRRWLAVRAAAGFPRLRLYDLRHTSATMLLSSGANLKAVSIRLGHENAGITLKFYAHALPGDAEALGQRMGELIGTELAPTGASTPPTGRAETQ